MKATQKTTQLAPISEHEVYAAELFAKLVGLGPHALRQAKRRGLRMVTIGNRQFVSGRDFAAYLAAQEADELAPSSN